MATTIEGTEQAANVVDPSAGVFADLAAAQRRTEWELSSKSALQHYRQFPEEREIYDATLASYAAQDPQFAAELQVRERLSANDYPQFHSALTKGADAPVTIYGSEIEHYVKRVKESDETLHARAEAIGRNLQIYMRPPEIEAVAATPTNSAVTVPDRQEQAIAEARWGDLAKPDPEAEARWNAMSQAERDQSLAEAVYGDLAKPDVPQSLQEVVDLRAARAVEVENANRERNFALDALAVKALHDNLSDEVFSQEAKSAGARLTAAMTPPAWESDHGQLRPELRVEVEEFDRLAQVAADLDLRAGIAAYHAEVAPSEAERVEDEAHHKELSAQLQTANDALSQYVEAHGVVMPPPRLQNGVMIEGAGLALPVDSVLNDVKRRNDLNRDGTADQLEGSVADAGADLDVGEAELREEIRRLVDEARARGELPSDSTIREPVYDNLASHRQLSDAEMHVVNVREVAAAQARGEMPSDNSIREPIYAEAAPRWTVQELDPAKGVYVDLQVTASAIEAHKLFQEGESRRVIDNELKEYALDYVNGQPHFHERSGFGKALDREQVDEFDAYVGATLDRVRSLQAVVDRRAELEQRVDQRAEALANAVDGIRAPGADAGQVRQEYELAAREYAEATQAHAQFLTQPTPDKETEARFRELEAAELAAEEARRSAESIRLDGTEPAALATAVEAAQAAQERLQAVLDGEGVHYPADAAQRAVNAVEPALTSQQIDALMTGKNKPELQSEPAPARPHPMEGHNQVRDHSAFADAAARDRLVPEDVAATYKRDGQKFLDANDPRKVAFVDKGNRLQTVRTFDDKAVEAMISTADARGWSEVTVTGDEGFRRKAWIEAAARGIEVRGYTPTEQDKLRSEQLGKQTGHANAIEKNATLEAYKATRDAGGQEKRAAGRDHPDLVSAFALEQAARSFAKQRLAPADQERFVERTRENIERDLAQGKKIPEIRRRQETERRQEHGHTR